MTFLTCYISFALGLALGADNAMTILGGLIGYCFYRFAKLHKRRGFLIGATMGFSIALSNSLVGVAIYVETYDKRAFLKNILKVTYSCFLAYFFYSLITGSFHSEIYFENVQEYISGVEASTLILIPLICISLGYHFSKGVFFIKNFSNATFLNMSIFL